MKRLAIAALLAASLLPGGSAAFGLTTLYTAQFQEANGSGAFGQAFMVVDDSTLYLHLDLNGFEADKHHPITIQSSFMSDLEIPPLTDINHDGIIDRNEAHLVTGDTIFSLVSASQANPGFNSDPTAYLQAPTDGYFEFSQTYAFDFTNPAQAAAWQDIQNLEMRTIEIMGLTVNGNYRYDVPAAIALITPAVDSQPPAIPEPSTLTLVGIAATGLMLRRKR